MGMFVLLITTVSEVMHTSRALTDQEVIVLQGLFSEQVDYSKIRISTLPLPASMGAFVIGNHIIYQQSYHRPDFTDSTMKTALLVHEVAHVWANQQHGYWTTLGAVKEHLQSGQQVYAIRALDITKSLENYRLEQQARILSQYFINLHYGFELEPFESIIRRSLPRDQRAARASSNL